MARGQSAGGIQKTNAMRELDELGVDYLAREYELDDEMSVGIGIRTAAVTGVDPLACFKTLVCVSPARTYAVCCIPSPCELDLKKAARAAGAKSLSLLNWRDLPALTGYVRGGCTPLGLKKPLPVLIDETVMMWDTVSISGGRIGLQLLVGPSGLVMATKAELADLIEE